MAMIYCPECGNMVSDKAPSCIHCGTPLQVNKTIKIKIPCFRTGAMANIACETELYCENQLVWSGYSGSVASFEIEAPTTNAVLLIKKAYTGGLSFKDFTIQGNILQGKKYEIKMTKNAMLGNPTKAEWIFSEVDFIDSGM